MKAPEKIYIFENPITGTPDDRWLSKRSDYEDIEYTRTDAFIEKAQSFFRQSHYLFCLDGMDLHNFIEDFKKYIEE